ncbi:hypothetical protein Acid345_3822 [Candidatus Koribacter versatilis Ellin345]|uniref:Nucleotidyltransferase family protein n=1 Tax=Koribacter versatilis (strain Ellin345) TaxID=204669 RepID=Q1IJX8_KORVE|nr:nucleotidyltransferase family protein [Candidatus Koribacter versatilis]ABF42822.1 hypothetical protein Acid345_3822 [Candidatus Koribacter versatilis Ellin345]
MTSDFENQFLAKVVPGPAERLVLLACSSDSGTNTEIKALYEQVGDEVAWQVAKQHELEGNLGHRLIDILGEQVPLRWRAAHETVGNRIGAYLNEVDRMAARLAQQDIPLVALKNAGIARGVYQCAGCSPMGDVDLLVRRADYRRVHAILLEEGFTCDSRNVTEEGTLEEGEVTGGTEYHKEIPDVGTFWLELQWRPVSGRWLRPDQEPNGDELVSRSVPIEGTHLRLLNPEDNLLQVCLHTAKHTYLRAPGLRLHTDVERIVRQLQIDWEAFLAKAKALQVRTSTYFSLWLPARLLNTPVPDAVLSELAPSRRKRKAILKRLQRAGLFYPARPKFSNIAYIRFNSLLYDSSNGLVRAIFPDTEWMKKRYGFRSALLLPYYHVRRIADLGLRRVGI